MSKKMLGTAFAAVAIMLALCVCEASAAPPMPIGHGIRPQTTAPLFSQYYAPPHRCGGIPAQMYVSPLPTPRHVGHTYITNQALMPHEFLYRHHRTYYKWHPYSNYTKTKVWWW